MGKKKNKRAIKKLNRFMKRNRVTIAALTGAAAGIAIASLLGTEKARQLVNTVEESIKDFTTRTEDERPAHKNSYKEKDNTPARKQSTPSPVA